MTSIKERMRMLEQAKKASQSKPASNVLPSPSKQVTKTSTVTNVNPIQIKIEVQKPISIEEKPTTVNNARKIFEEMANRNKQPVGLPLKQTISSSSETKPKSKNQISQQAPSTNTNQQPIITVVQSHTINRAEVLVEETSSRVPEVFKMESISQRIQKMVQPKVGMSATVPPRRAQIQQLPRQQSENHPNLSSQQNVQYSTGIIKPSQMKENGIKSFINMFESRVGKPHPSPNPSNEEQIHNHPSEIIDVRSKQSKIVFYTDIEIEKRTEHIINRLFNPAQQVYNRKQPDLPECATQTVSKILSTNQQRHLPQRVIDTVSNILHLQNVQPTNKTQDSDKHLAQQAQHVINRGAALKKNKKKQTCSFDDM